MRFRECPLNLSDLDLAAISQALDDYDPDREHYLDLTEGSIWTFVFSESTDETRNKHDRIRLGSEGAHVRIPSITTQQAYEEIEDFVEGLTDESVQDALFGALEKKGAFRSFREAILAYPQERQQWMVYRKERSRSRLEAFLGTLQGNRAETGSTG